MWCMAVTDGPPVTADTAVLSTVDAEDGRMEAVCGGFHAAPARVSRHVCPGPATSDWVVTERSCVYVPMCAHVSVCVCVFVCVCVCVCVTSTCLTVTISPGSFVFG